MYFRYNGINVSLTRLSHFFYLLFILNDEMYILKYSTKSSFELFFIKKEPNIDFDILLTLLFFSRTYFKKADLLGSFSLAPLIPL